MRCFYCNKQCKGAASVCSDCAEERAILRRSDTVWNRQCAAFSKLEVRNATVRNSAMADAMRMALAK